MTQQTYIQARVNQHNLSSIQCPSPPVYEPSFLTPLQERCKRSTGSLSRWRARTEPAPLSDSTADWGCEWHTLQPSCQNVDLLFPVSHCLKQMIPPGMVLPPWEHDIHITITALSNFQIPVQQQRRKVFSTVSASVLVLMISRLCLTSGSWYVLVEALSQDTFIRSSLTFPAFSLRIKKNLELLYG